MIYRKAWKRMCLNDDHTVIVKLNLRNRVNPSQPQLRNLNQNMRGEESPEQIRKQVPFRSKHVPPQAGSPKTWEISRLTGTPPTPRHPSSTGVPPGVKLQDFGSRDERGEPVAKALSSL